MNQITARPQPELFNLFPAFSQLSRVSNLVENLWRTAAGARTEKRRARAFFTSVEKPVRTAFHGATVLIGCGTLDLSQCAAIRNAVIGAMAGFVFRCPNTNLRVQGFVADDPKDHHTFEPVRCIACTRIHIVNPKTGKVLGGDNEK